MDEIVYTSQSQEIIDFEQFKDNFVDTMNARYDRIFIWYGIMTLAGVLILELRKKEKISSELGYKILRYIHGAHIAMVIWLLFPMLF